MRASKSAFAAAQFEKLLFQSYTLLELCKITFHINKQRSRKLPTGVARVHHTKIWICFRTKQQHLDAREALLEFQSFPLICYEDIYPHQLLHGFSCSLVSFCYEGLKKKTFKIFILKWIPFELETKNSVWIEGVMWTTLLWQVRLKSQRPRLGLPAINLNQRPNLLHRHLLSTPIRQSVISRDSAAVIVWPFCVTITLYDFPLARIYSGPFSVETPVQFPHKAEGKSDSLMAGDQ